MNKMIYQDLHPLALRDALYRREEAIASLSGTTRWGKDLPYHYNRFATLRNQPVYVMTVQIIVSEMLRLVEMSLKQQFSHITREDVQLIPTRNELGRMNSVSELEQWLLAYYGRIVDFIKEQQAGAYTRVILPKQYTIFRITMQRISPWKARPVPLI